MKRFVAIVLFITSIINCAVSQDAGTTCGPKFKASDQTVFEKAKNLYKGKRYKESRELMHKVSAKYPSAPDPYFYLGMMSTGKNYNAAGIRKYFTKLISLCPNYQNALAHYYKGIVDYTDEQYESAIADMQKYFDITNQTREAEYEAVYEEASNYLYWSQFLAEANKNKVPFEPTVMLGVSSSRNEYLPYLAPDGKTMYYLRQVPEDRSSSFYKRELDRKIWRLYSSSRRDTTFTEGVEMAYPFNTTENEGSPTITADGKTMYYSMMRLKNGVSNCDIYVIHNNNGKWGALESAGVNVNGEKSWESQPSITADGQYLYFASNRDGGMGGTDIWRCHRLPNGDWSRAENLGPSINTPGNEKCPFIHADGKTLYFASNGWQGFGGYDMYFINVNSTHLQRPKNMGLPINTEDDEICFGVTTEGSKGYYAGKPTDGMQGVGGSDIYFFELYPSARPEAMRLCEGSMVSGEGAVAGGRVYVYRKNADRAEYIADSVSGKMAVMLSEEEDNYVVASANDFVPTVRLIKAETVRQQKDYAIGTVQLQRLKKDGRYKISGVQLSGSGLTEASKTILDAYIVFLREHPMVRIRIEGTTDNMVNAVYNYMTDQKLRSERITVKAGGTADLQFVVVQK